MDFVGPNPTSDQMSAMVAATYEAYTATGLNTDQPAFGPQTYYWLPLMAWHDILGYGGSLRTETGQSSSNIWNEDVTVAGASDGFRLRFGSVHSGYSGLYLDSGMQFTTHDRDQDAWGANCASDNGYSAGGFWYSSAQHAQPAVVAPREHCAD